MTTRIASFTIRATYERLESPGLADGVINETGDRSASRASLKA